MTDTIENKKDGDGAEAEVISATVEENPLLVDDRPEQEEFHGAEIDEKTGDYRKPTQEQIERMDKRMTGLSKLFDGADFDWSLDGAFNISLYGKDYIRDHKDVDLGIFQEDLQKLEEQLKEKHFAIFFSFEQDGKRSMRPVTAEQIKDMSADMQQGHLMIRGIKSEEKENQIEELMYDSMDLHIRQRDKNGDIIGRAGITIPKEYFETTKKELPNGGEINLSKPVAVAYYKIHEGRDHDSKDLEKLKPYLTKEDVDNLKSVLAQETEGTEKIIKVRLADVWASLSPIVGLTKDPEVIKNAILYDKDIYARRNETRVMEYISMISDFILKNPDLSFDDFVSQSMLFLDPSKMFEEKLKILEG